MSDDMTALYWWAKCRGDRFERDLAGLKKQRGAIYFSLSQFPEAVAIPQEREYRVTKDVVMPDHETGWTSKPPDKIYQGEYLWMRKMKPTPYSRFNVLTCLLEYYPKDGDHVKMAYEVDIGGEVDDE